MNPAPRSPSTPPDVSGGIVWRPTTTLRLHSFQQFIPAPDEQCESWRAFTASIRTDGVLVPLVVTADGQILDGGFRWRAASQLKLSAVPCVVRPESEAMRIVVTSLIHRKHFARGAAAYVLLGAQPKLVDDLRTRSAANLRRGSTRSRCVSGNGLPELAREWGLSERTLSDAIAVFKLFRQHPELKAKFEPLLLAGEASLQGVLKAASGSAPKPAPRRKRSNPLTPFEKFFAAVKRCAKLWPDLGHGERREILKAWRVAAAGLPRGFRREWFNLCSETRNPEPKT